MKIKVLIIEDDPITSKDLFEILQEYGMVVTGIARSVREAKVEIAQNEPDVILVDIKLQGEEDGIQFVKDNVNHQLPVIYLSANSDSHTLTRAIQTGPSAFLTKPFESKDVAIAIELAFNNLMSNLNRSTNYHNPSSNFEFIFLKTGISFEKVKLKKITYLEADGSYTKVFTEDKYYLTTKNLGQVTDQLDQVKFIRVHRTYTVNVNYISKIDKDHIYLRDTIIPIGRSYRKNVNRIIH